MPILNQTTYTSLSLCIAFSCLYRIHKNRKSTYQAFTQVVLLLHTIYILHKLLVMPPRNVFTDLNLPLNTPSDVLRAIYLQKSTDTLLNPVLDSLLQKLGSFDLRVLYVRFGHQVLATCDYCHSFGDYAMFALPPPLLEYIREIAFIGILTFPTTPLFHLRPLGIGTLILAALVEAYWIMTAPVIIPSDLSQVPFIIMWHDALLLARTILFLLLPLALHLPRIPMIHSTPILSSFIPIPDPRDTFKVPPTIERLNDLQRTLNHLVPGLHLLKYTRAAIMRVPNVRERAAAWWDVEEKEGQDALKDDGLRRAAKGVGLGYEQSPGESGGDDALRRSATFSVQSLKESSVPSEHWQYGSR